MLWIPHLDITEHRQRPILPEGDSCDQVQPCGECDSESLLTALRVARDSLILGSLGLNKEHSRETVDGLQEILKECRRVVESHDFGNSEGQHKFSKDVLRTIRQIIGIELSLAHRERRKNIFIAKAILTHRKRTRPTFKPNLLPWQQFLNAGAPAVPNTRSSFKGSVFQLLPYGALSIAFEWTKDYRHLIQKVVLSPEGRRRIKSFHKRFKMLPKTKVQGQGGSMRYAFTGYLYPLPFTPFSVPFCLPNVPEDRFTLNARLRVFERRRRDRILGPSVIMVCNIVRYNIPVKGEAETREAVNM